MVVTLALKPEALLSEGATLSPPPLLGDKSQYTIVPVPQASISLTCWSCRLRNSTAESSETQGSVSQKGNREVPPRIPACTPTQAAPESQTLKVQTSQ